MKLVSVSPFRAVYKTVAKEPGDEDFKVSPAKSERELNLTTFKGAEPKKTIEDTTLDDLDAELGPDASKAARESRFKTDSLGMRTNMEAYLNGFQKTH